ncbi:RagB/SusD family nutrient uptake outer membrane protein [Hymenobacter guriensis]|uniref:RagB/SusD family nutrient uptake outer membrane protein n=1 Tax=Hymenobacter guriensis TaxID=2793065 RepID=A0ABS0L019_9BACT|nr:RagB/SusD family nutrient uptake outer membrane protein [Hymenobacter guriensis]MBG8553446.1 RagB/SusD family nutrient uptake outer membrane protein [Hymenobacter guriensis]
MKLPQQLCLAGALALLTACSLQEEPYGFNSTNNFYKTEADANAALIYAYSILPEIEYYSRNFILVTELPTENITLKPDAGASNFEFDKLAVRADNPELTTAWRYAYIGANRANAVIANVPGIAAMSEANRNQIVGEAYFLRALHYFNLVRLFGEVPLKTEPVTSLDQANSPKASLQAIYALIEADLKKASELMDATRRDGRVNKVAAWGLLAKVYLTQASGKTTSSPGYEFVGNADALYAQAKTYAGNVLSGGAGYGLDPDLKAIFDVDKKNGPEHIFAVATDRSGLSEGNFSKLPLMFIPYIDGAVFKLSDSTSVRSGYNHFVTEPAIYNSFADTDKRKTELIPSKVYIGKKETTLSITGYSRPFTRKYLDPKQVGEQTSANTPVLRYSDVVLLFAEASGPTAEGYAAINQIRQRAGLPNLTEGLSTAAFRDAVVQERAWELAFEGNRLFDLRRTHKMEQVLVQQYGKTIQPGNSYFYPIPTRETDLNTNL